LFAVIMKSISPRSSRSPSSVPAGARERGEAHVARQLAAEPVGAPLHPFDVARLDAELVLHQAAHVDRGRHAVFRHAAALALEVGAGLDALRRVDEEVAVAKHARGKHRDRDERRVAVAHQARVVRQRHLRGVEFLVLQHAPEDLGRLQRDVVEIDAVRLDRAVAQGLGAVVRTAGEVETQIGHEQAPR
jgi:hypothetical protein